MMLPRIMRYTGTSPNGIRPPLQPATLQKGAGWSRVDSVSLELPDEGTRRRAFASLSHADLPVCCSADLLLRLRRSCATTTSSTTTTCWTCKPPPSPRSHAGREPALALFGRRLRPREAQRPAAWSPTDRGFTASRKQRAGQPTECKPPAVLPPPAPTAACPLCSTASCFATGARRNHTSSALLCGPHEGASGSDHSLSPSSLTTHVCGRNLECRQTHLEYPFACYIFSRHLLAKANESTNTFWSRL